MGRERIYFELSLDSLRAVGGWAAECAGRALPIFERRAPEDPRPRAAIDGIRAFAVGGRRAAALRTLAMAAHAAAREAGDPAAAAAARAAGFAAASAYTHPLADVHQTAHIVGPAAYAALALELDLGDPAAADGEVRRAVASCPAAARAVLLQMPAREAGRGRLDALMFQLDSGVRAGGLPIHTPSLTLRLLAPGDAAALMRLNAEPTTRRWLPSHVYADMAEAEAALAALVAAYDAPGDPARGPYVLGVALRTGGELIGHVGLSPLAGEVEVSYAIAEAARGRGYGAEALAHACRWAARAFALPRLVAVTAVDNAASRRTLARAGFRHVGDETMRFQGSEALVSRYAWEAVQGG